ncbi:hypothetical protein Bbelb_281550 [Branchiostoma belcheri]|nr:hypothetical protein Bbelb_281550 [Branchiostoma belcheri]
MDDVTPEQLNVGFLRDFISLPESYFSPGAEIIFQNFYLRWGTHYIKSAKFGGQLKIIKTKQATQDLSMSEFATKAQADWKMTLSTFSAQASQTKSSSWFPEHESKTESQEFSGKAASDSESQANRQEEKQASSQQYSNEVLVVQGGDQKIAAAITEMYTTALTTELKDWLESINDYPKPFSFVLRLVSDLLNIPFASLFPAGNVDYGCFGRRDLKTEVGTGRKYYTQNTAKPDVGNNGSINKSEPVTVTEIRYCNFENRKALEDSMTKRRLALQRAVTVYLEEGRLLSSDFLLPAGEAGCETAMLAFLQENSTGVPTWEDMTGGKELMVVFDMPYDIPGILQAQDVLTLKFYRHKWFSTRKGFVPHLYDGYKNGGSNDVQAKKGTPAITETVDDINCLVSVQGLVMTYDEGTGVFTVTEDDFNASATLLTDLPEWVKGRDVARAEYKKLLNHLSQKSDTVGDVPCSIQWTNAHRFDPTDGGKCIHFTAASEGDIFVVFASIPQNHETWIYVQITPEGVALYKALRLQTTQLNDNAGGLGSATLYQSYFVCVTEDVDDETTIVQYGKTPDNEERPHVWLSFTFNEVASLRYYSFGSGESPVKVMGLSLLDKPAKDFIICREGTEMINGVCQQKCHSECNALPTGHCHYSGHYLLDIATTLGTAYWTLALPWALPTGHCHYPGHYLLDIATTLGTTYWTLALPWALPTGHCHYPGHYLLDIATTLGTTYWTLPLPWALPTGHWHYPGQYLLDIETTLALPWALPFKHWHYPGHYLMDIRTTTVTAVYPGHYLLDIVTTLALPWALPTGHWHYPGHYLLDIATTLGTAYWTLPLPWALPTGHWHYPGHYLLDIDTTLGTTYWTLTLPWALPTGH